MDLRSPLQRIAPVTGYQFAIFRILFGLYLSVHFANLIPYAAELFSRQGVLPSADLNPVHLLPSPLAIWDFPFVTAGFVVILTVLSLMFTVGLWRRPIALVLWYGWGCLFNRNNLISNPSLAYVGFMLLASSVIPAGEPLSFHRRTHEEEEWVFPGWIFTAAWILLALGYTVSGLIKLQSPSWLDGTALWHVVNNPLARPGLFRDLFLAMPTFLIQLHTWGSLALEILFLPLALFSRTRPWVWLLMMGMHIGILAVVNFADLTLGMLMIHLFTFNPRWLPARTGQEGKHIVLYDGICGLCDGFIQLLLKEDHLSALRYAPLQGPTAAAVRQRHTEIPDDVDSVLYLKNFQTPSESVQIKSDAVMAIWQDLGGIWRVLSWAKMIPRSIRDWVYDAVARNRYHLFGKLPECRIPSAKTRALFME